MLRSKRRNFALLIVICAILFLGTMQARAQSSQSWDWLRWDVAINQVNTSANSFHVTDTQVMKITQGSFVGGDRSIGMDRVSSVDNIEVKDGDTKLKYVAADSADNCPTTTGIYCVFTISGNQRDIYYNFTSQAGVGDTHTIQFDYDVHGALRSYKDGDQLWWSALSSVRDFRVLASRVTVQMPADRAAKVTTTYPNTWKISTEGSLITFTAPGTIGTADDAPEIRIQYPHDPAMTPPPWQAAFDSGVVTQASQARQALLFGVIGLMVCVAGPLGVLILVMTRGRDPKPVIVPDYLAEPPDDQRPAVVSTLLAERAKVSDIMATLLDLARRGFIVIEQSDTPGMFGKHHEFTFHRTDTATAAMSPAPAPDSTKGTTASPQVQPPDAAADLRPYERTLMAAVFRQGDTTPLSQLQNQFYTTIPTIQKQLYEEVVQAGYFQKSPESVRSRWKTVGGLGILLSILGFCGAMFMLTSSNGIGLPFIGLGITSLALYFASRAMPAKTALGSQEAAKWRAFRKYLANIKTYTKGEESTDLFDRYTGYAIAFGLNNQWFSALTPTLTSVPAWYYPTYLGGNWHGGYSSYRSSGGHMNMSTPGLSGGSLLGGKGLSGDLNQMSDNLTHGLNGMSSGLTSLLNNATGTMGSRPTSNTATILGIILDIGLSAWSGGGSSRGGSSGGGRSGGH